MDLWLCQDQRLDTKLEPTYSLSFLEEDSQICAFERQEEPEYIELIIKAQGSFLTKAYTLTHARPVGVGPQTTTDQVRSRISAHLACQYELTIL